MRSFFLVIFSLFMAIPAWADVSYESLLNTVTLQLNAEQWVTTKTALVTVGVNASVSGNALEKTQNQVLNKLNQISNKDEWHIISFNRNLDQSGLERVQILAQVRLMSSDLAGLRDKAKAISVPGETYTLDNVEFTPSAAELRDANSGLRNEIYQQAKAEIANLNKIYPDQKYYLHNASFIGNVVPAPMAENMMYMRGGIGSVASAATKTNLIVGNKLNLSATIVIASAPNPDVSRIVHG